MKKAILVSVMAAAIAALPLAAEEPYRSMETGFFCGLSGLGGYTPSSGSILWPDSGGFVPSLGIVWHLGTGVSLRAAFSGVTWWDQNNTGARFGAGRMDFVFHPIRFDAGSIFAGPSFTIARKVESPNGPENFYTMVGGGLVAGGQYMIGPHVAVFAEIGVDFLSCTGSTWTPWQTVLTRSPTVGVILYLNPPAAQPNASQAAAAREPERIAAPVDGPGSVLRGLWVLDHAAMSPDVPEDYLFFVVEGDGSYRITNGAGKAFVRGQLDNLTEGRSDYTVADSADPAVSGGFGTMWWDVSQGHLSVSFYSSGEENPWLTLAGSRP